MDVLLALLGVGLSGRSFVLGEEATENGETRTNVFSTGPARET